VAAAGGLAAPAGAASAAGAAGAAGAAAADGAAPPAISVSRSCYVNAATPAPITVTGTGWTPNDNLQVATAKGDLYGTAVVGADGTFTVTLAGTAISAIGPGQQSETLTATDEGGVTAPATGQTASTTFQIANLAFTTAPHEARFTRRVTFTFSGFIPGREIYAHYVHRGKVVASQRFGRARGVCGTLKTKALQYPGGHPRFDSYTVQFDDARRYARRTTPRNHTQLSIIRS
jgi:hypothetical protein